MSWVFIENFTYLKVQANNKEKMKRENNWNKKPKQQLWIYLDFNQLGSES